MENIAATEEGIGKKGQKCPLSPLCVFSLYISTGGGERNITTSWASQSSHGNAMQWPSITYIAHRYAVFLCFLDVEIDDNLVGQLAEHQKNCESCQSQATWKVKFKCQFCLSCLSCPKFHQILDALALMLLM